MSEITVNTADLKGWACGNCMTINMHSDKNCRLCGDANPFIASTVVSDSLIMPKSLTAENGAKALLIGEFHEDITLECPECSGLGSTQDLTECGGCFGSGEYVKAVDVSWTTIKEIYAMAAKHLGKEL